MFELSSLGPFKELIEYFWSMFCFLSPASASRYKRLRRDVLFRRHEDDSRDEGGKKKGKEWKETVENKRGEREGEGEEEEG